MIGDERPPHVSASARDETASGTMWPGTFGGLAPFVRMKSGVVDMAALAVMMPGRLAAALGATGTIRPELDFLAVADDDVAPKRPGRVTRVVGVAGVDMPVPVVELTDRVTNVIGDRAVAPA